MGKMYDNALDEFVDHRIPGPLTAEVIEGLRNRECSEARKQRRQRMIDHGDVDPGYFDR